jgi:hypothetical protein
MKVKWFKISFKISIKIKIFFIFIEIYFNNIAN